MAGKPECMHGCRYALKIALVTIFAMGLFNLAVADITRTVGPDGDYSAIEDAMTALLPFQDNVILEVYVGPDGLAPSVDITNSSSFNGYTLTLKGVRAFFSSATYYLNDEIEYEVQHNTTDCKTTEYTKGASLLSRRVTTDSSSSGDQYYIKNHLGSTMLLTSGSGDEIIASFDYFPYGKKMELALTSEYAVTQTFTEKEQDRYDDDMDVGEDGEGWYYFGARYYDSDIGMWTSVDPRAEDFKGISPYHYNLNNPIKYIDPNGEGPVSAIFAGASAATGTAIRLQNTGLSDLKIAYASGLAGGVAALIATIPGTELGGVALNGAISSFSTELIAQFAENNFDLSQFSKNADIGALAKETGLGTVSSVITKLGVTKLLGDVDYSGLSKTLQKEIGIGHLDAIKDGTEAFIGTTTQKGIEKVAEKLPRN
jgi:RHS repeat-associated protein